MGSPPVPMRTLAIDIETASPNGQPTDFADTDQFELVAVALGYRTVDSVGTDTTSQGDDPGVESTVLFRRGGWRPAHTADLLDRVASWASAREPDRTITYNGRAFDAVHLRTWAESLAAEQPGLRDRIAGLFADHRDVAPVAGYRFADRLDGPKRFPAFEEACAWLGVPVPETRYDDFDVDPGLAAQVDRDHVTGTHVGETLGAAYVEGVANGDDVSGLEALLAHYATADVAPLLQLADELGVTDRAPTQ